MLISVASLCLIKLKFSFKNTANDILLYFICEKRIEEWLGFLVCFAFIDLKFSSFYPMKPRENILKSQESRTHNLFFNIYLFIYYEYNILFVCMLADQKRAPGPITDGCEPPCGCWELNSGPLEEQAMPLTSEPSLQPLKPTLS